VAQAADPKSLYGGLAYPFRAQEGSHVGALQTNVGAQSAGSAQLTLQALLPSQAYGAQFVTCEVHCPLMLPAPQVITVSVAAAQVVAPQEVPAG
jgi:hypothetical protein